MEANLISKIKELLNHGLIYGLTSSLQNLLGFILLPILTVYYTTAEFGIYSIILLVSTLAGSLFYFGASSALGRFYFDEDSDAYRKKIVSSALFITLVGAIILILLSLFFGKYLSFLIFDSNIYYLHIFLACSSSAFGFLLSLMTLILRYEKQSMLFMKVTLAGVIINFTLTYTLLSVFSFGILAPLYGSLLGYALSFFFLLIIKSSDFTLKFMFSDLKKIFFFGIQTSLASFLFYFLDYVDRLILKELAPMSDVGIYSLGSKIGIVINILLILPFTLIWAPMRMEYAHDNIEELTKKVFSYFVIIGFILVSVSILFGDDLMSFVFVNKEFAGASKVFPIIMLALLFYSFQNIVDFGIYLHKKIIFYSFIFILIHSNNVKLKYRLVVHHT